jgi:hypothetical protein
MGDHPEDVLEYRREQFEAMGFGTFAGDLAASNVDLRVAEDLVVKRGCEPWLAFRILQDTGPGGTDESHLAAA